MKFKNDGKEALAPSQFYLDENLSVPGAERILSVLASVKVNQADCRAGEIRVGYRVRYRVIYKAESGIESVEEFSEKQQVLRVPNATEGCFAFVDASVISTEYVGCSSLKVRLCLELGGYFVVGRYFETVTPKEDWQVKNCAIGVENILPIPEKEVVAEREFELKEGLGRVLSYDTQVLIRKLRAGSEIVEAEGECYTYLTYVNDANLLSRCLITPFRTEILVDGAQEGAPVYLKGRANSTTITQPDGEGSTNIRLEIVVGLTGYVLNRTLVEVPEDAYSTACELKLQRQTVRLEESLCLTGLNETFSGSVRLSEGEERVRSVLSVCPPSLGAISVEKEENVKIEGVVACDVLYLSEEDGIVKTVAQIPYSVVVREPFACEDRLSASVSAYNLSARARHNDEIELSGELSIELFGSSSQTIGVIADAEEGEAKEENDAALILYLARPGEDLFAVAKALNTTEEILKSLNPELTLPLAGGEKILLYKGI